MARPLLWNLGTCAVLQLALAGVALAKGPVNTKTGAPIEGTSRSSGGPTSIALTAVPVSYEKEFAAHLDVSVAKGFAIGLEGNFKNDREEAAGDRASDSESRRAEAAGAALLVSAFTGKKPLTGFYGALGAGYRKEAVKWRVEPDANDRDVDLTLVKSDQRLHHDADLKGPTAHLRAGYRVNVSDSPLLLGAYVGGRYFRAEVSDAEDDGGTNSAPMTASEKNRLAETYASRVEAAVEVGVAF